MNRGTYHCALMSERLILDPQDTLQYPRNVAILQMRLFTPVLILAYCGSLRYQ